MAVPGDPHSPDDPARTAPDADAHAHDDLIGFTSPASLSGRGRPSAPEPAPEPVADASAEPSADQPEFDFEARARARDAGRAAPEPSPQHLPQTSPGPSPVPAWAVETAPTTRPARDFGRAGETPPAVDGALGLYTVYALILFAVPTLGVSALVALVAIWGRPLPDQPLARSHVLFQKRTLWIAAIAAVLGAVLIAVNLGVFVLFIMAVWVILRGAWGVMTLAGGRTIADPHHWLISRTLS